MRGAIKLGSYHIMMTFPFCNTGQVWADIKLQRRRLRPEMQRALDVTAF